MRKTLSVFLGIFTFLAFASGEAWPAGHFKKVMTVVLENTNYDEAVAQPFLSSLVAHGALLSEFLAEAHPSQPNYIAMISGSTHGVVADGTVNVDARHIGDLLEAKGLQWKVYAEKFPGNCFLGATSGKYARKHIPFISFKNVQSDPKRCARIVEASALQKDVSAGTLPDYSLYIPDLNNDGHDTGPAYADKFLSGFFGPLLQNPAFTKDLLLVVTFDESESYLGPNHIFTVLYGDGVTQGVESRLTLNHYSLMKMIEDEFSLGNLGQSDASAATVAGIWR
ncbi:MAG: alkaline phosphatase family protein [Bdellovibrionota bacterium]